MAQFKAGDHVAWQWAGGLAQGMVRDVQPTRTEIVSKGKTIVRNGTADNPALVIDHQSGSPVLKLASEVQKTSAE